MNHEYRRNCLIHAQYVPPWPNGQGVGPLIRRLRAQVPQGVGTVALDVPARESLPDDAYITFARIAASFA